MFSATRYEGFNDGMLWEPPEREEELVEPHRNSLEAWKDGRAYGFTIESKAPKDFIGRISIRKEKEEGVWNIGFWTHPLYQGQGYMSECALAVIDFGFTELKAQRIEAYYALWNKASERVLMKIGMSFIEHIPHGFLKKGRWIEENRLGISRQGWHLLQKSLNQPDGYEK